MGQSLSSKKITQQSPHGRLTKGDQKLTARWEAKKQKERLANEAKRLAEQGRK
jgi:hypothetical protein